MDKIEEARNALEYLISEDCTETQMDFTDEIMIAKINTTKKERLLKELAKLEAAEA